MTLFLFPFWVLFSLTSSAAQASCECACVDGIIRPVCSSSTDVEPVCHPRVCSVVPPAVEPVQVDPVPPPNTEECQYYQVYSDELKAYEWRSICE